MPIIRNALSYAGRRLMAPGLAHIINSKGRRLKAAGAVIADSATHGQWSYMGAMINRYGRRGSTQPADKFHKGHTPPKAITDPPKLKAPPASKGIDAPNFEKVAVDENKTMWLRALTPGEQESARKREMTSLKNALKTVDTNFSKVDKSIRALDERITKSDGRLSKVVENFNKMKKAEEQRRKDEMLRDQRAAEAARFREKSASGRSKFNNFGSQGAMLEADNENLPAGMRKAKVNSPGMAGILAGLAAALGFAGVGAMTKWIGDITDWVGDTRKMIGDRLAKDMEKREKQLREQKGPGSLAAKDLLDARKSGDKTKIASATDKLKLRGQYVLAMGKKGVSNALATQQFNKKWKPGITLEELTGSAVNTQSKSKTVLPKAQGTITAPLKPVGGGQRTMAMDIHRDAIEEQKSRFLQFGSLPQGFEFLPGNQGRLGNAAAVAAGGMSPLMGGGTGGPGFSGMGQYTGQGSRYRGQSATRHHRSNSGSTGSFTTIVGSGYTPSMGGTVAPGQQSSKGAWRNRVNVPYRQNGKGVPASVRYNNPGASYPRARDELFGLEGYGIIGGGHKIGKYPTVVHGLASNMDLFHRSKHYQGKTLFQATRTWRGGATGPVPRFRLKDGTEIGPQTVITPELTSNPEFMRKLFTAYGKHESGRKQNPFTTEQIDQAFKMKMSGGVEGFKRDYPDFKPTEMSKRPADKMMPGGMPGKLSFRSRDQNPAFRQSMPGQRTISADFNYSSTPDRDKGFLMVAPNNATKDEIAKAHAYRDGFGKLMAKYGYKDYKNIMAADGKPGQYGAGIVSRKENLARINKDRVAAGKSALKKGGGIPGFFHLESGLANDPAFAKIYSSEEFQREHAKLLRSTMGQIEGSTLIAPHTRKRQGAHMPIGGGKTMSERQFYQERMFPHLEREWNAGRQTMSPSKSISPTKNAVSARQGILDLANAQTFTPMKGKVNQLQMKKASIRRRPISGKLQKVLDYASAQAGVEVDIWSGGQRGINDARTPGLPNRRTGSTRHDNGNAADLDLYINDNGKRRKLSSKNPKDRVLIAKFIKHAGAAGATGMGTGQGYMGDGRLHVGFGRATTWGGGMVGDYKHAWREGQKLQGKVNLDEAPKAESGPVVPQWGQAAVALDAMRKKEHPQPKKHRNFAAEPAKPKPPSPEEIARRIKEDEGQSLPKQVAPAPKTIKPPKEEIPELLKRPPDESKKQMDAVMDVEAQIDKNEKEKPASSASSSESKGGDTKHRSSQSAGRFPQNHPESQPASEGSDGYGSFGRCFV